MRSLAAARPEGVQGTLGPREFQRIAAIIHADAGISLPPSKTSLVYSRLAKRLRALNLDFFSEYCSLVEGPKGVEERRLLLSALTTNVTNFFREPHHFEDLKVNVLPALIDRAKRGGRVRLWSAACSSGQEPYSIALTALSLNSELAAYDFRILATDIDPEILAVAKRGRYANSLLGNVGPAERRKWFEDVGDDEMAIDSRVKSLVTFREMNLVTSWPVKGPFDVIFCRNVVIYFDAPTEKYVWKNFANVLADDGRLYIGHSERVSEPASASFRPAGVTTYMKKSSTPQDGTGARAASNSQLRKA